MPKIALTKKQLEKELKRLRELAYKDELTGLFNRRGFKEESARFLAEVTKFRKQPERRESFVVKNFGLILFDIDNFKKLNDTYGHEAGDKALQKLAAIIAERVREIDIVSRWGGEEIIVGLVGAAERDAYNIAESIREKVKKETKFTVSGGVVSFDEAHNFDKLFELADKALYKAKNSGKNKIIKASSLS